MSESDTGTELTVDGKETEQHTEVVTTDVEGNAAESQADNTESFELQIDSQGEPDKTPESKPDYEMARKAFKEREEKRKKREQEEAERKALIDRVSKLESGSAQSNQESPPTLADCDYDEDEYQKKVAEFYSKPKPEKSKSDSKTESYDVNPEIEIKASKQEDEIRKKLPDYDDIKTDLAMKFADEGVNPDAVIGDIQQICHYAGIDSAKAIIALSKVPGAYEDLKKHANNAVAASRFLGQVSEKVRLATAKKVDTVPEPDIKSSGAIDNTVAGVEKLRKQWLENSSAANFRAYTNAKNKLKVK